MADSANTIGNPFTPVKGVSTSKPRPSRVTSHSPVFHTYSPDSSLPFPLNLPPSYPTRLHRPQGASVSPSRVQTASKPKQTQSLDAFMHSRQVLDDEPSSSDSDTSLYKIFSVCQKSDSNSTSTSKLPLSSSPASSSPLRTPRETSADPLQTTSRTSMCPSAYPSSPTSRLTGRASKSSISLDASHSRPVPYTLPPGPYSAEKPSWSLAALIGQAINASHSGALPLNDIYTYVSTVYPHFDRRDQAWMSSVRHSLSVNDAFERVADQEGTAAKRVKSRGKTRLKGGFWRIQPGYEECFLGGNYVRKGAKGAGPGMNPASSMRGMAGKKRAREDGQGELKSEKKKARAEEGLVASGSGSSVNGTHRSNSQTCPSSSSSSMTLTRMKSYSSPSPVPISRSSSLTSQPPSSLSDPIAPPSQQPIVLSVAEVVSHDFSLSGRSSPQFSKTYSTLEAGFELELKTSSQRLNASRNSDPNTETHRELFTRVLASSSAAASSCSSILIFPPPFASSSSYSPSSPLSPQRSRTPPPRLNTTTPPPRSITPSRTPISHRGLHMSPSRSLAHYKTSFEPEWKLVQRSITPPPLIHSHPQVHSSENNLTASQVRFFRSSSPFQTPLPMAPGSSRGYDPYDPDTLLGDEIERMRRANEVLESPGGFFGKAGRKLLYESPSIPGKSDWRFREEGL